MNRSPNLNYRLAEDDLSNSFKKGNNQINKRFRNALDVLLTPDYYEGSKLGKYYNKIGKDGRSSIYVPQEELERQLQEDFVDRKEDLVMFLVGYTGVGKTTLIRNFFKTFDRNITETDNNLIVYISFYSTASSIQEKNINGILRITQQAIDKASTYVSGYETYPERLMSYNNTFYKDLYLFIANNNSSLAHDFNDYPYNVNSLTQTNIYQTLLLSLEQQDPIDYKMSMLKYYLDKSTKKYNNIFFIFDDLETQSEEAREEIIHLAMHIKKCMQAFEKRSFHLKCLISLRNYAFRMHEARRNAAFRVVPENDVILKDMVPALSEVIDRRVKELLSSKELADVSDYEAYKKMGNQLSIILNKMYGQYDEMILRLTHYNIFTSMKLLIRIVTNKRYFGQFEQSNKGAFKIKPDYYPIQAHNSFNSALVFYALIYGENDYYVDHDNYYLTNILHYREVENKDNECLPLYVIQYLITNKKYIRQLHYASSTLTSDDITNDILSIFNKMSPEKEFRYYDAFMHTMRHLYEGGILLQSIVEPIYEDGDDYKRVFKKNIKVYLSLRGYQLYQMLLTNSLLLETYRDDIDTNLQYNDILTMKLSKELVLEYCISYTKHIFHIEQLLFNDCSNPQLFIEKVGPKLAAIILLTGIRESIVTYYSRDTIQKAELVNAYNNLCKEIHTFISERLRNDAFELPQYIADGNTLAN